MHPLNAASQTATTTDASLLDRIVAETRLAPDDETYAIARRGVAAFIAELLKPGNRDEPVKKALVDRMIAEIDSRLGRQMDAILHHPEFQSLEAAWRGLKLLVERTDFRENIRIGRPGAPDEWATMKQRMQGRAPPTLRMFPRWQVSR